ncbi:predicted protein [Uncinocarpus reesii 1704]|uniref:Uncharacterized protein n=1 Tax=Uncinocarpus reesii (strain UAMH 1704) TaxID=336963 RepID=C4JHK8_UNCRE|nr:uncharacterized protein UREG_01371 [Uncinocarpus reesii 1704]EEP76522.1 predicted protein [Uncinocarpus reesii 1704]
MDPPGTPPRPPYSPVTPVMAYTNLTPIPDSERMMPPPVVRTPAPEAPTTPDLGSDSKSPRDTSGKLPASSFPTSLSPAFAPEPPPVPISESENPDAIALRSAISVLQIQKQQALRDIRTLDKLKQAAAESPETFAREIIKGNLVVSGGEMDIFSLQSHEGDGEESDHGHQKKEGQNTSPALGTIPKLQNVVRMPPVNWAKYHIVGEPLDRLHEEQRRRPSLGEPRILRHVSGIFNDPH